MIDPYNPYTLIKELARTFGYPSPDEKGFRIIAFQLYFYKKLLEEFLKRSERWIKEEALPRGIEFPNLAMSMVEAKELIERVNKACEVCSWVGQPFKEMEEKRVFEEILKRVIEPEE